MKTDIASLWSYSAAVYEEDSTHRFINRLRFLIAGRKVGVLFKKNTFGPLYEIISERVEKNRRIAGFIVWPYVNNEFDIKKRFTCLATHYSLLMQHINWADLPPYHQLTIADLNGIHKGLVIVIEHAPWFIREGALNLSMMLNSERVMSVSFTLGEDSAGICAYVGSIQGAAIANILESYKTIASSMNNLRPRDLLFKIFRIFSDSIGITNLYCVSDDYRVHNHAFFGDKKSEHVKLKYNELWQDQGGDLMDNGFYRIPAHMEERPLADVPTKKRGRYKRRIAMLAAIGDIIRGRVAELDNKKS